MSPNYEQASYELTNLLIDNAKKIKNGEINVLALNGNLKSQTTQLRSLGLKRAIATNYQVNLLQEVNTDWSQQTSYEYTLKLLKRFPLIDVIFAASDEIAIGAIKAIKESRPELIDKLAIGGFDWLSPLLPENDGQYIDYSAGGHIYGGALALAILNDHFNGHDFTVNAQAMLNNSLAIISNETKRNVEKLMASEIEKLPLKLLSHCASKNVHYKRNYQGIIDVLEGKN